MPADIYRQFAVNNLPDHGNLLNNIVRWAVNSDIPLQVDGAGMVDCHLYKQNNRFVFQIVNLTSTATWRQPLDEFIPVGPLNIKIKLPSGITPKDIRLSVSRQKVNWGTANGWVHFEIKSLVDHELAVIL
jgi:hypothetical protein